MLVKVFVHPRKDILHPASKAVARALSNLGFREVQALVIGRYFEIEVGAMTQEEVAAMLKKAGPDHLYNPIIEDMTHECVEGEAAA